MVGSTKWFSVQVSEIKPGASHRAINTPLAATWAGMKWELVVGRVEQATKGVTPLVFRDTILFYVWTYLYLTF